MKAESSSSENATPRSSISCAEKSRSGSEAAGLGCRVIVMTISRMDMIGLHPQLKSKPLEAGY